MWAINFSADDRRALAHDRYHHPDPRVQRKMEVLWLKSHGLGHDAIAAYADVSRRTVQRYLEEYLEGGLSRLCCGRGHQPRSALVEHRESLEEYFLEHPPRSARQAQAIIAQQTGVRRGLTQVGYSQELCLENSQAAGFSLMPSMKIVPLMTSASSGEPFNDRQLFDADSISL